MIVMLDSEHLTIRHGRAYFHKTSSTLNWHKGKWGALQFWNTTAREVKGND